MRMKGGPVEGMGEGVDGRSGFPLSQDPPPDRI